MTINGVAQLLLQHLSPEERSIPDHSNYPGRNAAVMAAINGALQEMHATEYPWVGASDDGAILNAPTTVTLQTLAGSKKATVNDWQAWMGGCTIAITGETIDNRIINHTNPVTLLYPASSTGSVSATVYHDCLTLETDVAAVRSPVMCDNRMLHESQHRNPARTLRRSNDYGAFDSTYPQGGNCSATAGQVRFFRVEAAQVEPYLPPLQRITFFPAPATTCRISYRKLTAPNVVTTLLAPIVVTTLPANQFSVVGENESSGLPETRVYTFVDFFGGRPLWSVDVDQETKYNAGQWTIDMTDDDDQFVYRANVVSSKSLPWEETFPWTVTVGAGQPIFTVHPALTTLNVILESSTGKQYRYDGEFHELEANEYQYLSIPSNYIESILIPLCEYRLMDSPFFRTALSGIGERVALARKILKQLNPSNNRSPRIIALG